MSNHKQLPGRDELNPFWTHSKTSSKSQRTQNYSDRFISQVTDVHKYGLLLDSLPSAMTERGRALLHGSARDSAHVHMYGAFPSPAKTPPSKQFAGIQKNLDRIISTPTKQARYPLAVQDVAFDIDVDRARSVSKSPAMVLDAPCVRDDYYIDILDWSCKGQIVVGLGGQAYLWDASQNVRSLDASHDSDYLSVCKFSRDGDSCALAWDSGRVIISNLERTACSFVQLSGVSSLAWTSPSMVATGDRNGTISLWDLRASGTEPSLSKEGIHRDRVVGMDVSPNGTFLATGCNGHLVHIWDFRKHTEPVFTIRQHESAVRAISFCPYAPNLLVTGGGRDDGQICFHNLVSGRVLKKIETIDQGIVIHLVCSLIWSISSKELVSMHSRTSDQICLWDTSRIDQISCTQSITAHDGRPMYSALSPDGQTLATVSGGDETLKLWNWFQPVDKALKSDNLGLFPATIR